MRKTIATVCLSGSLTEKLTAAARAGFDGVELFENDLLASPLPPEEIRSRAADLGLTIDLYQPMRDVEAVPEERFAGTLRRAERKFDVMCGLGADLLLVCSSVSPHAVDDDALAARQLRRLAEPATSHGIRVAYEALAWGRHVRTYDHAWHIVEQADHPALGVCLDSFHILTGVDHVALTQPWHHYDEAVLFHRAVLGLRPQESVDLADPYGLLRSRALSDDTAGLRLVLNLAPGPETHAATRAQHIALTTHDIAATARRLRTAGAELLEIPPNYYDDLDGRYEFAPGELDTYRELGILYDRDDHGGEFRHLYTSTVGRVFVELVQRTGGYRGYGASNATVRLAAQRRQRPAAPWAARL